MARTFVCVCVLERKERFGDPPKVSDDSGSKSRKDTDTWGDVRGRRF